MRKIKTILKELKHQAFIISKPLFFAAESRTATTRTESLLICKKNPTISKKKPKTITDEL